MGIKRLSHIVLYVPDVERSVAFYNDLLGFIPRYHEGRDRSQAVFTSASASDNQDDHDLAFFKTGTGGQNSSAWVARGRPQPEQAPAAGVYHFSWQVETLEELQQIKAKLKAQGLLGFVSEDGPFKRVYGHDLDGILFEVSWFPPDTPTELSRRTAADTAAASAS